LLLRAIRPRGSHHVRAGMPEANRRVRPLEGHLRRVLRSYARYYNEMRTHRSLDKDAPLSRPVQRTGSIKSHALLGGFHHHYNYLTSALPRDFRSTEPLNKSCLHFALPPRSAPGALTVPEPAIRQGAAVRDHSGRAIPEKRSYESSDCSSSHRRDKAVPNAGTSAIANFIPPQAGSDRLFRSRARH
jgi:hypothetical protein